MERSTETDRKMINRATITIAMLLAMATVGGCQWDYLDFPESNPFYRSHRSSFVTFNERDDTIRIHGALYDDRDWSDGVHTPGVAKTCGPLFPPYAAEARFLWRDGNDKLHKQTVKIAPPISNGFRGRLYFRFRPDGSIKLTPVTWEEWARRFGEVRLSEQELLQWKDKQVR